MRFFLVRIVVFTILFTLLFLLLSWIAPTRTGKAVHSLTSRLPGVEKNLVVTDTTKTTEPTPAAPSQTKETTDEDMVVDAPQDDVVVEETTPAVITAQKDDMAVDFNQKQAISEIDDILGVDGAVADQVTEVDGVDDVIVSESNTLQSAEPTTPVTKATPVESAATTLNNDDLSILRQLQNNTQ